MYTFLLRNADTVTSQNTDLTSWDTLYIVLLYKPETAVARDITESHATTQHRHDSLPERVSIFSSETECGDGLHL
jgi:hypothetical protein